MPSRGGDDRPGDAVTHICTRSAPCVCVRFPSIRKVRQVRQVRHCVTASLRHPAMTASPERTMCNLTAGDAEWFDQVAAGKRETAAASRNPAHAAPSLQPKPRVSRH
jgi:hypothetical protein